MKTGTNNKQWWRSPPVLIFILMATAALLFFSGRAAVIASAGSEDEITVHFHANGGSGSVSDMTVKIGVFFTLPDRDCGLTRDGYTLVRWCDNEDGTGILYYPGGETYFTSDKDLYALWQKDVTVSFDANGGNGDPPAPISAQARDMGEFYEDITIPDAPSTMTKDGYRFICWNTAPDGSGDRNYYAGDEKEFKRDTVLYAQWGELITVSFDANGASGTVPDPFMDVDAVFVTFPNPTELVRPGFEFQYWCSTPVRTTDSDSYSIGDYHWFYEDTVFYAIWEEIITVSYDLNGGTGTTPDSVTGLYRQSSYCRSCS